MGVSRGMAVFLTSGLEVKLIIVRMRGVQWRNGAEFGDNVGEVLEKIINLRVGVVKAQAETDAAAGAHRANVHGGQHV